MPYFGQWPEWMGLYLESCSRNPMIDWLFITDCGKWPGAPTNVSFKASTLGSFLKQVESRLGIRMTWNNAYKICDLRPAFGEIFEKEIRGYQYFGWGDVDVIFGNMKHFLTEDLLANDCISFSRNHLSGHLCLWKNEPRVRSWFRQLPDWKERMEDPEYTHFDEPPPSVVPKEFSVYAEYSFNTPLSPKTPWTDGTFDCPSEWYWRDGILTNDKDGDRQFLYLHFMHWKGGPWARQCGNAQWEKFDRVVHIEPRDIEKGFRINDRGFYPLTESGS